ncbi:cupin [Frondihabitans sp. PAMC 28766]|uniref:cupin domain-containing protein n=1 Tax=Frondihabitans sp. PAMC 28766 TaxID=1795630 RepID=UPI00078C73E9|nr:cupin domain-containing protein [Frondihabitans sp. PAMC 28766]AMM19429.1 cupin [Frondihabitans sp. PAMC 28766]
MTIATAQKSRHVASLVNGENVNDNELGRITTVTADSFPILQGMSIKRLVLEPGSFREPHWHTNADEIAYCLSGTLLVTILDNASAYSSFTIAEGQMFHVDSGMLHHIENTGSDVGELVIAFNNAAPAEFSMHAAFGAMTDAVLGNAYGLPAADFEPLVRDTTSERILQRPDNAPIPDTAGHPNPHKFDLGAQTPPLDYPYASAQVARNQFWPALKNLSMYSIEVEEDGMREPHWHPQTSELGYVHKGRARMTILDPDGSTDTYLLEPGDVYFVPRAYPHQIEVIGDDEIHFLIFFDQPYPGDIGYRAAGSAISRPILASVFNVEEEVLPHLPFTAVDPLLVSKVNSTDPVA